MLREEMKQMSEQCNKKKGNEERKKHFVVIWMEPAARRLNGAICENSPLYGKVNGQNDHATNHVAMTNVEHIITHPRVLLIVKQSLCDLIKFNFFAC
jgi:hypothetical protein